MILSCIALLFFLVMLRYLWVDGNYFNALSSQPHAVEVQIKLGKPGIIVPGDSKLEHEGWPIPKFIPKGTNEIWIYNTITGRRFYVFVNSESFPILGFFSSVS